MYLDRETYERAGLVGNPHGAMGGRGSKPRWSKLHEQDWNLIELTYCEVVEYDLRSPSALHGKKGFDRLVFACKNALNAPTTWLFCNLSESMHSSYISNLQSGY